jgi:NAD(P)-dependent dehydrogenase (short-subunit alcohol dehydrogenase family)
MADKRVALITGSARGLGREIAERLGRDGFSLALCDINRDAVAQTAAELGGKGLECFGFGADVTDEASIANLFAEIDGRFGRLDVAVNNAGVLGLDDGRRPLVESMSLALWNSTLSVNLTGAFLVSRGAIPLMKRNGWGRIVNISSRAARMKTGLGNSNYAASKAGLIGFSRVMAGEVGRDGITVNCIAPSRIMTQMTLSLAGSQDFFDRNIAETAVGRIGEPRDVATCVSFLCREEASFITGVVLDVNGGSHMA